MVKIVEIKHTKGGQPKSYDVASSNVTIQINNDAEVRLPAGKGEIASMERKGHDLIVHYADGTTVRLKDYFDCPDPDGLPELIVHDPANGQDSAVHFKENQDDVCAAPFATEALAYTLGPVGSGGFSAGAIAAIGALAVGGIAIAAAGGGGDDDDGPTSPPEDTTPPAKPMITGISDNVDPVRVDSLPSGASTNDNTPTLSGTAEPNSTVTIFDGSTELGTATTDSNGDWTFTPSAPLDDGPHDFTVVATDPAGNSSEASDGSSLIVDTLPPVVTIDSVTDDQNNPLSPGGSTHDTTPTLSGTAEPNSTVTIFDGSTELGTATTDSNGDWTFTPSTPLDDGPHDFVATQTDAAGNVGTSTEFPLSVSNDAPVAVDDTATTAEDTLLSNIDVLGNDSDADGDPLTVTDATSANGGTVTVNPDGTLNYTPPLDFTGDDVVTYTVDDGNGGTTTGTITVTVTPV
ncbi:Ig-like domain-containing protein, partial [Brucella daejeonensis]